MEHNRHENRLANSQRGDPPETVVFAANGDYWTIGPLGATFSIKASKGLAYIHRLLQHPREEFHVLDLMSGPGAAIVPENSYLETASTDSNLSVGRLGDAGEMLDGKAKQDYKRRLVELRGQLEDAQELGNSERAAEIESEIDFLAREISRAIGLGGRDRRAGSVAERARLNVTRAIKTALQKISEYHSGLGEMLDRSVHTGSFCSYVPYSPTPTVWKVSLNSLEPTVSSDSTAPLLVKNELAFTQIVAGRTRFVGREPESADLDRVLKHVRSGEGRVVIIGGAPGVGKTRIATEFCAKATHGGLIAISGSCYEREEPEPFVPFVEILETWLARAASPEAFLDSLGDDVSEIALLLPQLRRMFPEIPAPSEVAPEHSRRILLTSIANVITRAAKNIPVVVLLEDLHWADESTLAALTHLARSLSQVPLLVVGTYRDNELDGAGPLAQTLDELNRLHILDRLSLSGISEGSVAAMIHDLSGSDPSPTVVEFIYSITEGNPFFVEEVFRHLLERGELMKSGAELLQNRSLSNIDVPPNVRLAIGRRLAKLSESTQRALGTAALIGRSFTFSLLEAATGLEPDPLLDQVEEAEKAGLILSGLDYPEARFQFSHELVRQAASANLSSPRRQRLHLRIADAIESMHADAPDEYANDLAHHLLHSGNMADPERTVKYLAIAAKRALVQSTYHTALQYLRHALELVATIRHSPARDKCELELQMNRGIAVLASAGWHVAEYLEAYSRARELCLTLGQEERLLEVLFALRFSYLEHGDHRRARVYADEIMQQALRTNDETMLVAAFWSIGSSQFFMGEFSAAHMTLDEGIRHYDFAKHSDVLFKIGQDPCMSCLCHDAQSLWTLGYPDRAEQRAAEALSLARKINQPHSLAYCFSNLAIDYLIRREYSRVLEYCEESIILCRKHGLGLAEASIKAYSFIAQLALGKRAGDLTRLRELARRPIPEYQLISTCYRSTLAEVFGLIGDLDTAFALLAQAHDLMERNDERFVEPDIHRIRGELMLRSDSRKLRDLRETQSARSDAEASFRKAIELARRGAAKMFELRASVSLARLMLSMNRNAEAFQILTSCCSWFTEGFDTPEMKSAKGLLKQIELPEI